MSIAIKVENLQEAYQIAESSTGLFLRIWSYWWAKKLGVKGRSFLNWEEEIRRSEKEKVSIVWSLKNVNFEFK